MPSPKATTANRDPRDPVQPGSHITYRFSSPPGCAAHPRLDSTAVAGPISNRSPSALMRAGHSGHITRIVSSHSPEFLP